MADLISRQEAINALFDLYEYQRDIDPTEAADLVRQGIFLAEKKIEKLQSIQPERKVGKWIVDEKRFGCTERHCSLCGAILEGDDWKWRNNNYCYHCGARMVEGLL